MCWISVWGGGCIRFHNLFSFNWNYVDQTFYDGVIWLQITGETKRNTKKAKVFCEERGKSAQQHLPASVEPKGGRNLIKF